MRYTAKVRSFLKRVEAKSDFPSVEVGDVLKVVRSRKAGEESVVITVLSIEGTDGFYYFYGDKKPQKNRVQIHHSNMFLGGIHSVQKIGKANFKMHSVKSFSWTVTGIPEIDTQLATLDERLDLFRKYATEELKDLFDDQEDRNYHSENAKMVQSFAEWIAAGKKASDFKVKASASTFVKAAKQKQPIKRQVEITLTLKEAALAFGHKDWLKTNDYLDGDSQDDVHHEGYSETDALSFSVRGMDDVEKIFPLAVAIAAESAERDGYASAIRVARRDALVEAFELVHVAGEYMSDAGEMISVKAGIESATIDQDKITVVIDNPEHLINDIVNGVGYFAAPLDPYEKASDEEIKSYLISNINDFFDVYGERKPDGDLDERFTPNIDERYMADEVKVHCSEMSMEETVQAIEDAVEEERLSKDEAITLAAKYSGKPKNKIAEALKNTSSSL